MYSVNRVFSRFLLLTAFLFFVCLPLAAQDSTTEDPNWFWGKTISEISFEGLKNVKKSELTGITSAFIGKQFTEDEYNNLVDRLYGLDMFTDITPYAKHDPKTADEILLVFKVKERPVIKAINFEGNKKIRNGELRESVTIKTDDIYLESKVLLDERALRDVYLKKGYTDAKITHKTEETAQGIKLTFVVDEGANTVITSIRFSGNTVVSERTLKSKISLKEAGFMKDGAFQKSSLEADKQTIITYYQDRGYADAKVVDVMQTTNLNEKKNRNELTLTFVIQEGAQYTYTGTTIKGNEIFKADKLISYIKLKEGAVYNQTKYQEGMQGITSLYAENGYMSNQYIPEVKKDAERKTISFALTIIERSRSHIENIIIKGNTKTKDYVIRREIPLEPGDVFSRDKVMSGLRNLYNLQYFSSVVPEPVAGSESGLVDLVITVEEQSTTSLEFGMTFSGVSSPDEFPVSLFAKWQNSNLKGEGKTVSASTTISSTDQSVSGSYGQNWLFDLPVGISESLSVSHSKDSALRNVWLPDGVLDNDSYYMQYENYSVTLSSSLGRRWTPNFAILSLSGGVSSTLSNNVYDESLYTPLDSSVNQTVNRFGLNNSLWTSFSMDNRDINYDPSKGWFTSQRIAWCGLIPGVEKEFFLRSDTKLELYATLFNIPFGDKWSLKGVLADYTGFTTIFPVPGSLLGDSNKVYIDGMFNARGWTSIYNSTRGKAMLSNRLEFRVPLVPNVLGVDAFLDAAAVKSEVSSMFSSLSLSDFYYSTGPGIRFLLPQFPLHLLFANTFKYDKTDGFYWVNSWQFVLSFNITNK
ncbi:MAG: outer membrane protein assembly factor BamA [Treponema sp.]|nr:outer membrane protein assembly factor BamA [Treponema sp.]